MTTPIVLPQENYAALLEAERNLTDVVPEFAKAESCGIDCSPLRAAHKQAMEQIEQIKINYAPKGNKR